MWPWLAALPSKGESAHQFVPAPTLTVCALTVPPHLTNQVFIERAAKAVRRMRLEREKKAAEERAERLAAGRTPGG